MRKAVVERYTSSGAYSEELVFDETGELTPKRHIAVSPANDGGRVEVEAVAGLDGWSPEGLTGVWLGTGKAATAETRFSSDGAPIETLFKDDSGDVVLQAIYVTGVGGRVVEIRQYSGPSSPLPLPAGTEVFSIAVRYDSMGRPAEQITYVAGEFDRRTTYTHNDHGDLATSRSDDEPEARFEYEYDHRGNWTRQLTRSGDTVTETRRRIVYYD